MYQALTTETTLKLWTGFDAEMKAEMKTDPVVEVKEVIPTTPPAASTAGTFETYSADKLALASDGTVVLFFHANWCPSCRGLENDINAKLSQIPANTHILKLDYSLLQIHDCLSNQEP